MIFNPDNSGIIYAVDYDGKYFRSDNWGDSWTDLSSELIIPGGVAYGTRLGVSAADPNVVYVATIAGQTSVFKSTDAGLNFDLIKTDYPNLNGYSALEEDKEIIILISWLILMMQINYIPLVMLYGKVLTVV